MPALHDCWLAEYDDGSVDLRSCDCARRFRRITIEEAEALLATGAVAWKKQRKSNGAVVETHDHLFFRAAASHREIYALHARLTPSCEIARQERDYAAVTAAR